jgi:Flp pilus assembly protein TadG
MLYRPISSRRRGTVAVAVAFGLITLLGVVALSLDGGALFSRRRSVQAAADAAALAAACDLYNNYWSASGTDPNGTAKASALATALADGYNNDGTTNTVTVNIPPQSGPYAGLAGYVEVIIQFNEQPGFSSIFSSAPVAVRARAVALGSPVAANVGILVLDPTGKGALNAQGGGNSTVSGTPVIVNSTNATAAIAGGGGSLSAQKFIIAGGYATSGNGSFQGPIYINHMGMADPLSDLPVPDPSTMTVQATHSTQYTSGNVYLQPGVYKGGISASGTASLTLAPGIYYMDGGGFSFSGQGSLTGNGVMIYNAPGNGNSGGISVSGQGSINISAPTSGVYKGVTFFQDRTSSVTGNVQGTGGTTNITGTFYFAGALLNVSGNGGVTNLGSQYISYDLNLGGTGGINISWQPNQVAQKRSIYLVE